jgi:hypothetical protein
MAAAQLAGAAQGGVAEPVSPCVGINDIKGIDQMPGYWLAPRWDRPAMTERALSAIMGFIARSGILGAAKDGQMAAWTGSRHVDGQ